MSVKFRVTKWFHPYLTEKKISAIAGKKKYNAPIALKFSGAGVYLIKKNKKIIYVGMSGADVKRTLYRHFQKWTDRRHYHNKTREYYQRVSYYDDFKNEDYLVKVISTNTHEEAAILEELLIKKIKPCDNTAKLNVYSRKQYRQVNEQYKEAEKVGLEMEDAPF